MPQTRLACNSWKRAALERSRWYGWEVLDTGSETNFWSNFADADVNVTRFGEGTCDYRVYTYHAAVTSVVNRLYTYNRSNGIGC